MILLLHALTRSMVRVREGEEPVGDRDGLLYMALIETVGWQNSSVVVLDKDVRRTEFAEVWIDLEMILEVEER